VANFEQLTDAEKILYARFGLFAGPFATEAAEVIGATSNIEATLQKFRELDLLQSPRESYYQLTPHAREFARNKLFEYGEFEATRQLFVEYYVSLAEVAEGELSRENQLLWLGRLAAEQDNLQTALGWALELSNDEWVMRLTGALGRFWIVRGHLTEGRAWLETVLSTISTLPKDQPVLYLAYNKTLYAAAILAQHQGDFILAERFLQCNLELCDLYEDLKGRSAALNGLALNASRQGNYVEATALLEEGLALRRQVDNERLSGFYNNIANLAFFTGDHAKARYYLEEGFRENQQTANNWNQAHILTSFALLYLIEENLPEARRYITEAIEMRRQLSDQINLSNSLCILAMIETADGNLETAKTAAKEGLMLCEAQNSLPNLAASCEALGAIAVEGKKWRRAAILFGAADALHLQTNSPLAPPFWAFFSVYHRRLQESLSPELYDASLKKGATLGVHELVIFALNDN
jgi:tetratricopeptide (TPR) repeat protein